MTGEPRRPGEAGDVAAALGTAAPGTAVRVAVSHPLALFVPAARVDLTHEAMSLRLLQVCPGTLRNTYERDAAGMLVRVEDRYFAHTLHVAGIPWQVEVHADQRRGRVSMQDWDFMVAIWRLWAGGGVAPDGTVQHATYRAVCRAADRTPSDENVEAAKRAFARWAGTTVHVATSVAAPATRDARAPRAGRALPGGGRPPGEVAVVLAGGVPAGGAAEAALFEREGTHWILEYDVEREVHAGRSRDAINGLRLNPRWLQEADGRAAFLNVELFLRLERMIAKRLLQVGTLRASDGSWRPGEPWVVASRDLRRELGIAESAPFKRTHESFVAAFDELARAGALRLSVHRRGRTDWDYEVHMGDSFLVSTYSQGIRPYDLPETRRLLWHLRAFGLSEPQARALVQEFPQQTLEVLRRAFWLLLVHGGRGGPTAGAKPVKNWGRWIAVAITEQWSFTEPAYRQWVHDLANGRRSLQQLPAGADLSATAALGGLEVAAERGEPRGHGSAGPVDVGFGAAGAPDAGGGGHAGPGARADRPSDDPPPADEAGPGRVAGTAGVAGAHADAAGGGAAGGDAASAARQALLARVLDRLAHDVPDRGLRGWFADVELVSLHDGEAVLCTSNAFARDWIPEKYGERLCALLSAATDAPVEQIRVTLQGSAGDRG